MRSAESMRRYVGVKEAWAYGLANGGQCFGYMLITSYLMYYYINVFQINPQVVSALFFIGGIWDVINNPLMGIIVDRTRTRYGKMLPYLRIFMLPLAAATIFLFSGPALIGEASQRSKAVYIFITYTIWELIYTITDVSFWGLSAALSPNPLDRTQAITAANISMQIIGSIPFIVVPLLLDFSSNTDAPSMGKAFFVLSLVAGVAVLCIFSLSALCVKERVIQSEERPSFKESIQTLAANKPLCIILATNIIRALGGIGYALETYYYIDVLGYASLAFLIETPAAVLSFLSYSLIPLFKRRFNSKQIMIISFGSIALLRVAVYIIGVFYHQKHSVMIPALMISSAFTALFNGVISVTQTEMTAETTDYAEWKTGKRSEGVSFSLRTTTAKIGGTMTKSFAALLLSAIGYQTAAGQVRVAQASVVQSRIWTIYYLAPTVLIVLSLIPMFFYDLVDEKRDAMFLELTMRRQEAALKHSRPSAGEESGG